MNAISNVTTTASVKATASTVKKESEAAEVSKKENQTGVIYEKSKDEKTETTSAKKSNAAIISKLKADAEQRTAQLRSIVEQMMTKQGVAIGTADDMWKFLAKGDFTVSADVKAQAQADIAEDGYWGVEQTSDRILDFAKALAGNDPDKAEEMLAAFKKGYELATKSWGDELPDISKRTYDAVLKKFDAWKSGTEDDAVSDTSQTEA